MTGFNTKHIFAGCALVLLSSTSAFAVDAQAFGDRLKAVLADQNLPMSFTAAEESGADVVLRGVTFTSEGEPFQAGDVTFEGVTGSPEEGYTVASVPFEDFEGTDGETATTVTGMVIEGLQIAGTGPDAATDAAIQLYFDRAAVGEVNVTDKGEQAFNLTELQITNELAADGMLNSAFNFGTFKADFAAGDDPEGLEMLSELGYMQPSGSISGEGSWNPANGELTLDPLNITVDEAGSLVLAYSIAGYTPSFIESLSELQKQMAAAPEGTDASGMAVIGLISQLSLKSAEITYEDASLTERLLDYYAKQNNQSREELVASLNGMLPLFLGYLQNPEFQTKVSSAIQSFLANPQSLTIAVAPEAPIPATQIIGAAMGAPQTLPTVLDLEVTANQ